ncbi:hypothetical protein V492_02105 [Pseudogymnoascus sp. VKM F-4246]|nr:hypothetical protein V492_02105 [Pseudogymnoascus sp. VKM F-4246]
MAAISRQAAQAVVARIREENGGISAEDRAASPPGVLRALENVRRKLGSATKTIATNLYSKDTRFVYELIQNAEDNNYERASANGSSVFLSFSLYPDRIVIDSNEDGFTKENVKAICSTGDSTKTAAEGYIGEKGIGFKSVFKVAKNVHIQSEPYSFSFEHTRDSSDDGLGMVTPLDEDYDLLPEDVHTRITLTLLDPLSFEQRAQDLLNIPDMLLLFLTRLKVLYINIYPQNGSATKTTYTHFTEMGSDLERVTKSTTVNRNSNEEIQYFYVTRKEINNLPSDEARKGINRATVVLAFPVDEEDEPIIEQQYAFAFLPLRLAGFKFLIQSDFITQASREDIFQSVRNESLLSGVAETFRDAVLQFCNHPALQYTWMRYLPSESISDEFWKNLRPKIISLMTNTPCLRSWSETSLYLPKQLYRLTRDCKDRYGEPLFADLAEEAYLSEWYTFADFKALRPLGTRRIRHQILLPRILSDLGRPDSSMKAITTDEDWHTRAAKLLSAILKPSVRGNYAETVKSMRLIPLQDQRWVSATDLLIFLPNTGEIPIPTDLGLNLIKPAAVLNSARKDLFLHLGVTAALTSNIISLIYERYRYRPSMCSMMENVSHLRYLYWNLPEDNADEIGEIFLMDQSCHAVYPTTAGGENIYFKEEEEEYGPHQLLHSAPLENPSAPGFPAHFLNEVYLDAVPIEVLHHGRSWKLWLEEFALVRSRLWILDSGSRRISKEFEYIIIHRPEKLVGLLKHNWSQYRNLIPLLSREIRGCLVPLETGSELHLVKTFLPLPRLKTIIERLKISTFPFLLMPRELADGDENEWQFLKQFGVKSSGGSDELHFYINALSKIADETEDEDECSSETIQAIFEVYAAIERNCSSSEHVTYIRHYFKTYERIYVPSSAGQCAEWVSSKDCVWSAPEWLTAKRRLNGVLTFADHEHLFRVVLRIRDANWKHYLEDLKTLKEEHSGTAERVAELYRHIWREFEHDSNWETIRTSFEKAGLVFVPSEGIWYPLSSCIWADNQVRIPRKTPIKSPYANLEDFFCRVLGIQKPDLRMHVQALQELARSQPPPSASEMKRTMMHISSMDPTAEDVTGLHRSNIFPVILTNGEKTFTNTTADFAIVDRPEYGSAFAGRIRILDYSVEEVRACRPLLLALGLKRSHLSELVEEKTTVQGGVINSELSQSFRLKAYALFRCTVHYRSQRSLDGDKSLYNKLLRVSIYVSDGISKSISVVQYGETITVENSRANFHLEEDDDELRLYVPRDENFREECYFRQLPRRLMTFFAISDPTMEALVSGIIGCRSLIAVDGILRDAGIVNVDGIERSLEPNRRTQQPSNDGMLVEDSTPAVTERQSSQSSRLTPIASTGTISVFNEYVGSRETSHHSPGSNAWFTALSSQPLSLPEESVLSTPLTSNIIRETGYAALLERVINSAARMAIPVQGAHSVDNLQNILPVGGSLFRSVPGMSSTERNHKIGAAGELLVFEMLLRLGLFGFSRDNWKSTIRDEVCVHNKYRDLEPWRGHETADITYDDGEGELTKLLIEKGYLNADIWEDECPRYYLEVKATPRDCNEQFYMSGSQFNHDTMSDGKSAATAPNSNPGCVRHSASFSSRGTNWSPTIQRVFTDVDECIRVA